MTIHRVKLDKLPTREIMMANTPGKSEEIRRFIVSHIEEYPGDIVQQVVRRFEISRQAANGHLQRLVKDKVLDSTGVTRNKRYWLRVLRKWQKIYPINASLTEGAAWAGDIKPLVGQLPDNALNIWHYGFTEMFNNVIDHSGGDEVVVWFEENAAVAKVRIMDNGVGIFKKIQAELGLLDERHAPLELSKGKFTTDPEDHSGEGIFFTSRMFDRFAIMSGDVYFSHEYGAEEDWILEIKKPGTGTFVSMKLNHTVAHTTREIFDQFASGDDYGFTKTNIPVQLAQYGDDKLVSRSQAKRLLTRIDRFDTVLLNFSGVESIGQAFADEIFRVFAHHHPNIELDEINSNTQVKRMIKRARSHVSA